MDGGPRPFLSFALIYIYIYMYIYSTDVKFNPKGDYPPWKPIPRKVSVMGSRLANNVTFAYVRNLIDGRGVYFVPTSSNIR